MRGQAALAVVWVHICGVFGSGYLRPFEHTPLRIFWNGSAAVAFFFVLSGFVLTIRAFRRPDAPSSLVGFYVSRALRICLPFAGVLILSKWCHDHLSREFVTRPAMTGWAQNIWRGAEDMGWGEVLAKVPLITPGIENILVPQAWTLTVELQLAILIPVLILVAKRSSVWLLAICAVTYWIFALPVFIANFAFGVLLAKHHEGVQRFVSRMSRLAYVCWGIVGIYLYNYKFWPRDYKLVATPPNSDEMWLLVAVGAAILLAMVLGRASARKLFMNPSLRFLGKISYSLYLVHFLVLIQFTPPLLIAINELGFYAHDALAILFPFATAVCIFFAYVFHQLVERPAHALARALSAGRLPRFAALSARGAGRRPILD